MAKAKSVENANSAEANSAGAGKGDVANSPKAKRGLKPKEGKVKKTPTKAKRGLKPKEGKVKKTPTKAKAAKNGKLPFYEMVAAALKELKELKNSRKGYSLAAIRQQIITMYDMQPTKVVQINIRKGLEKEFKEGRVRMTNAEGDKLLFNKRFALK